MCASGRPRGASFGSLGGVTVTLREWGSAWAARQPHGNLLQTESFASWNDFRFTEKSFSEAHSTLVILSVGASHRTPPHTEQWSL